MTQVEGDKCSRLHAQVAWDARAAQAVVIDLGSAYGTSVDGDNIGVTSPVALGQGSVVRFGAQLGGVSYIVTQDVQGGKPPEARAAAHKKLDPPLSPQSDSPAASTGYSPDPDAQCSPGPAQGDERDGDMTP